jgi:hypothetical protein
MGYRNLCCVAAWLVLTFALTGGGGAAGRRTDTPFPTDETQVAEAVRTMYAAATADDLEKFHFVVAANCPYVAAPLAID